MLYVLTILLIDCRISLLENKYGAYNFACLSYQPIFPEIDEV